MQASQSKRLNMETALNLSPRDARGILIQQTVAQIAKDFAMFGMAITFPYSVETTYPHIFNQLRLYLENLLGSDNSRLTSLLYHIDIPESMIMETLSQQPAEARSGVLSELIIFREFKKVVYRNHYRDHKKPGQIIP